jgi:hypothetical protein
MLTSVTEISERGSSNYERLNAVISSLEQLNEPRHTRNKTKACKTSNSLVECSSAAANARAVAERYRWRRTDLLSPNSWMQSAGFMEVIARA